MAQGRYKEIDLTESVTRYLQDPLLRRLYSEIRAAGPMRPIQIDLTHACNIRCDGCYFFEEKLDLFQSPKEEAAFDSFIEQEKARGTNYVTVLGGEPSLMLKRLKKIYDAFHMIVVTNGLRKIPFEGFENMPIGVSVWGDHQTDQALRGGGKLDVFAKGLENYRNDRRVIWYYTTTPGKVHEIESVTEQIVANGNYVGFNFYGDIARMGGYLDHRLGFGEVRREIDRMIERFPERIMITSHITKVIATGELYGNRWGFDVCCSLSNNIEKNQQRFGNGKPYLPHFRAYNPDLKTTRACCRSNSWDCGNCFDSWAHLTWIIVNVEPHLESKEGFTAWLTAAYLFHLTNRIVDFDSGIKLLPEIHSRLKHVRDELRGPSESPRPVDLADLVQEVL